MSKRTKKKEKARREKRAAKKRAMDNPEFKSRYAKKQSGEVERKPLLALTQSFLDKHRLRIDAGDITTNHLS